MPGTLVVTPDKPTYPPGATITITVTGNMLQADQVTVTDSAGDTGTGMINVIEQLTVDDPAGRDWTVVSNDGATAVMTAPA